MSSHAERHGHLDATAGREVVYCHACAGEWYRDENGLTCPECHGEITEIVCFPTLPLPVQNANHYIQIDPANDPRDFDHHSSASTSPEHHPYDSDPEEADIDEHAQHGFVFRRSVRDGPNHPHHHDPATAPTYERFWDMLNGFGPRAPGGNGSFPSSPGEHEQPQEPNFGPRIHRTTFTSGPLGGTTSVTIVSGPIHATSRGPAGAPGGETFQEYAQPPFQLAERPGGLRVTAISMTIGANQRASFFQNMLRDIVPPPPAHNHGGEEGAGGPPPGLAQSLQDILNLLNPANAMHGDAVYSQEALDRIITGLMEANPQSNAAPPATEEALKNLERKPIDKQMLGSEGKAECTICIDEMKEGDMATFLPCNHWFHEECVTLWLKEHNTCPICRTPIEKTDRSGNNNGGNGNNNNNNNSGDGNQSQGPNPGPNSDQPNPFGTRASFTFTPNQWTTFDSPHSHTRPMRFSRPPSQSQSRLNEALRTISNRQQERERERERERGETSGFSYDTSRLQRRSSHSPTSPRATALSEHGARMRQRSPSQSSRRSAADSDQQRRQSSHGPISWLRDRFGGGGPGNGPPREGRRE
ncbi:Putative RING finger protein P32A8.03c [Fusarium odoratissimum]|uniref:RING-type E3 ubiquitin transferase n=1 Tax=Fusarium oxysporum f. sp. cubense (strain race 4) TaxID=2502994 RepID=N1RLP8_FUSC4|nr:Putative RING finger protein P32A8.03c [Fusarium odoratissimum]